MNSKYQIIFIGSELAPVNEITETLLTHTRELGIDDSALVFINSNNFRQEYKANSPVFCVYFGEVADVFPNLDILEKLINDASLILPVVGNLRLFRQSVPESLYNINGLEFSSTAFIETLVSSILEGLGLLRLSRRLFISYKREESSYVAIQLFEHLEKCGFDVFLDTHSIRPGEPFQEELWQRLADTDIVVLLNTPGFLESNWTQQELAKANALSIGILQLVWPEHTPEAEAGLSIPLYLESTDFVNEQFSHSASLLLEHTLLTVTQLTESLRARSLAARHDNMVTEFISSANRVGVKPDLQPEKFIIVKTRDDKEVVVIPTVGVPQAFTYNQSQELVVKVKSEGVEGIYLLFDHRNIRDKWLSHLSWLDNYLPIKTIKIVEAEKWLETI